MKPEPRLGNGGEDRTHRQRGIALQPSLLEVAWTHRVTLSRGTDRPPQPRHAHQSEHRSTPPARPSSRHTTTAGTVCRRRLPCWPASRFPLVAQVSDLGAPSVCWLTSQPRTVPRREQQLVVVLVTVNVLLIIVRDLGSLGANVSWRSSQQLRRWRVARATDAAGAVPHVQRDPAPQPRTEDRGQRALEMIGQKSTRLTHWWTTFCSFAGGAGASDAERNSIDLTAFARDVVGSFDRRRRPKRGGLACHTPLSLACAPTAARCDRSAEPFRRRGQIRPGRSGDPRSAPGGDGVAG